MWTHWSKTNDFYQRPSATENTSFFVDSQTPRSTFSILKYAPWTLSRSYNIEKRRGGRNVRLGDWKTDAFNKTGVCFGGVGVPKLLLSMIVT